MRRVAAGAHLPTPWLFEPAKRPDDRADYCLDCSFSPSESTRYSFLHLISRFYSRKAIFPCNKYSLKHELEFLTDEPIKFKLLSNDRDVYF